MPSFVLLNQNTTLHNRFVYHTYVILLHNINNNGLIIMWHNKPHD